MGNKANKQRFINKIIADNKITADEARKAQNKGINLNRIERAQIRSYRSNDNPFARNPPLSPIDRIKAQGTPQGYAASQQPAPTYQPLLIKGGADRVFRGAGVAAPPTGGGGDTDVSSGDSGVGGGGYTPEPLPTVDTSATDALAAQISQMQQSFMQSMQQQQQMFQQMQASQSERMEALQQQMLQAQIANQTRPEVAGVKMADSGTGTPMQIARRGVTGAFGRRGMRIQGLNV